MPEQTAWRLLRDRGGSGGARRAISVAAVRHGGGAFHRARARRAVLLLGRARARFAGQIAVCGCTPDENLDHWSKILDHCHSDRPGSTQILGEIALTAG